MTMIFVLIVKTDKFYVTFMRNENNIFLSKLKNFHLYVISSTIPPFAALVPPILVKVYL